MNRLFACLITGLALVLTTLPAAAERLVGALSDKVIFIDSTFSGETLTLFGNVEPDTGSDARYVEGPYEVVVVINGPAVDRVAREKSRQWGIWLNTDQLIFKNFPSYYWVLSSSKLSDIADHDTLMSEGILPETRPLLAVMQGSGDIDKFGPELVRMMTAKRLFGVDELGVVFRSNTLFSSRLVLPADVPNGTFLAKIYLFKNGKIVADKAEGFTVTKAGFERLVGTSARENPWLYGLACVFLAVFTGWLGGVAFRR